MDYAVYYPNKQTYNVAMINLQPPQLDNPFPAEDSLYTQRMPCKTQMVTMRESIEIEASDQITWKYKHSMALWKRAESKVDDTLELWRKIINIIFRMDSIGINYPLEEMQKAITKIAYQPTTINNLISC